MTLPILAFKCISFKQLTLNLNITLVNNNKLLIKSQIANSRLNNFTKKIKISYQN